MASSSSSSFVLTKKKKFTSGTSVINYAVYDRSTHGLNAMNDAQMGDVWFEVALTGEHKIFVLGKLEREGKNLSRRTPIECI